MRDGKRLAKKKVRLESLYANVPILHLKEYNNIFMRGLLEELYPNRTPFRQAAENGKRDCR